MKGSFTALNVQPPGEKVSLRSSGTLEEGAPPDLFSRTEATSNSGECLAGCCAPFGAPLPKKAKQRRE